ncbi:MAG: response regulator [Acidobacteriia bacterium]|nr:response regulator [Terriglobia bacterium]
MLNLRKLSLRRSLLLHSLFTGGLGVVLVCAGFLVYDLQQYREEKVSSLRSTADMVGANSDAALLFDDPAAGAQVLSALRTQPEIRAAALYHSDGRLLASYLRKDLTGKRTVPMPPGEGVQWGGDNVAIRQAVFVEGKPVGTLYLEAEHSNLREAVILHIWTAAVMGLVGLLIVYPLSSRLSRTISRPIYDLAWIARLVAAGKNYALRSPELGGEELGQLGADFNHMLDEIERRDAALREARDTLEARVAERTAALRQSEELFRTLSEAAPVGIFRADPKGRCNYLNERLLEMVGLKLEEALGYGWQKSIHPGDRERVGRHLSSLVGQRRIALESHRYRTPDGREGWAEGYMKALSAEDGAISGYVGIVQDVTERRKAEEELREAKEAAEAANRAKSDFLAQMSHEIRTPMNGILGMTELALGTDLSAEQREYISMVKSSADALLDIINDILDFSKIEAGKIELERIPFSLHTCIEEALEPLSIRAQEKGLNLAWEVDAEIPDELAGDPTRLRQVLLNLAGNGVKFTKRGEVSIQAQLAVNDANGVAVKFTVADTGVGIPPEKLEKIFEAFAQADMSTTREYGGTGLGLSISTRLVHLMGGKIQVESEPEKGSRFFFTAHFGKTCNRARTGCCIPEGAILPGKRVLAADDSAINRRLLEQFFKRWEMDARVAASGREALELFRQAEEQGAPFDACVLDYHMPGMDGLELAARLREIARNKPPVLLLLASSNLPGERRECQRAGIQHTMRKPIRMCVLCTALNGALGRRASEQDSQTGKSRATAGGSLRILLAEDNPVNRKLAVRILEKSGHRVAVANDGQEAVARTAAEEFDLVLMDVQMPVMGGLVATQRIREREQRTGLHVPIIAMTAHALNKDRERCREAGMDGYTTKPIRPSELEAEIRRVYEAAGPRTSAAGPPAGSVNGGDLLNRVDGDRALVAELLGMFRQDYPKHLQALREAQARGATEEIEHGGHALKGMLANLAAPKACKLAAELEQMGKRRETGGAAALLAALEQELRGVEAALVSLAQGVQLENSRSR